MKQTPKEKDKLIVTKELFIYGISKKKDREREIKK